MEQPGLAMGGSSKWVRRRRWVRVMRRRLDRPSLPFADLDGPAAALHATSASTSAEAHSSDREVGALGDLPTPEADYVARARYTAGVGHRLGSRAEPAADSGSMRSGKTASRHSDAAAGKAEARRLILRLEVCLQRTSSNKLKLMLAMCRTPSQSSDMAFCLMRTWIAYSKHKLC